MKAITICMVYVMKAIMSPTCNCPMSMLWPPTQTIKTEIPFIKSIINGIINDIARFTNICVFIKFVFATSNRSSSYFSREKARITGNPVMISRETKLTRSTKFCNALNFGIVVNSKVNTRTKTAATATPTIQPIPVPVLYTR